MDMFHLFIIEISQCQTMKGYMGGNLINNIQDI